MESKKRRLIYHNLIKIKLRYNILKGHAQLSKSKPIIKLSRIVEKRLVREEKKRRVKRGLKKDLKKFLGGGYSD